MYLVFNGFSDGRTMR